MKMKSVAGIVCYVKDIEKTAKFYETIGFQFDKREKDHVSIRLNWFWIDFHPQDSKRLANVMEQLLWWAKALKDARVRSSHLAS